jgi:hypothetical protein
MGTPGCGNKERAKGSRIPLKIGVDHASEVRRELPKAHSQVQEVNQTLPLVISKAP